MRYFPYLMLLLIVGCQSTQRVVFQTPPALALPAGATLSIVAAGKDASRLTELQAALTSNGRFSLAASPDKAQYRIEFEDVHDYRADTPATAPYNTAVQVIGVDTVNVNSLTVTTQQLGVTQLAGSSAAEVLFLSVYQQPENSPLGTLAFPVQLDELSGSPASEAQFRPQLGAELLRRVQIALLGGTRAAECYVPRNADEMARVFLKRAEYRNVAIRVRTIYPLSLKEYLARPQTPQALAAALGNYYLEALAGETVAATPEVRLQVRQQYADILTRTTDPQLAHACSLAIQRLSL